MQNDEEEQDGRKGEKGNKEISMLVWQERRKKEERKKEAEEARQHYETMNEEKNGAQELSKAQMREWIE